jgi:hypothetical protein
MTARVAAAKVEAFLAALAETGNASLAATQAGLSRSWVNKARGADAGLDARVRAARAAAAGRLARCEGNRPPEEWRMRRGVELVVTRRGQIARAPGARRWTKRMEERFLFAVRETRNLRLAAPAVGMSLASLEKHRRRWSAFDRRVRAALRLSAGGLAMRLVVPADAPEEALEPMPAGFGWPWGMSVATAINTLRRNPDVIDDPRPIAAWEEAKVAQELARLRAPGERREAIRARIAELRAGQAARQAQPREDGSAPRPAHFRAGSGT